MVIFTNNAASPTKSILECLKACFIQILLSFETVILAYFFNACVLYGYICYKGWKYSTPSSTLIFLTTSKHVLVFCLAAMVFVLFDENDRKCLLTKYLPVQLLGLTIFGNSNWKIWNSMDVIITVVLSSYLTYQFRRYQEFDFNTGVFIVLTIGFCFYSPVDRWLYDPINMLVMVVIHLMTQALPKIIDELDDYFRDLEV